MEIDDYAIETVFVHGKDKDGSDVWYAPTKYQDGWVVVWSEDGVAQSFHTYWHPTMWMETEWDEDDY
jgi:hypothetical protein